MGITNLFLHLEPGFDLSSNDDNLDNHNGNEIVKTNNIVCSIPIKEVYNGVISYENLDGGTSYCFRANKQEIIQNLCISVKDCFGNWYSMTCDVAMMYPLMEICGYEKVKYNDKDVINDDPLERFKQIYAERKLKRTLKELQDGYY